MEFLIRQYTKENMKERLGNCCGKLKNMYMTVCKMMIKKRFEKKHRTYVFALKTFINSIRNKAIIIQTLQKPKVQKKEKTESGF